MIAHYLKIGLRNICRYKQQSVVSMVGTGHRLCMFCPLPPVDSL